MVELVVEQLHQGGEGFQELLVEEDALQIGEGAALEQKMGL